MYLPFRSKGKSSRALLKNSEKNIFQKSIDFPLPFVV